MARMQRLSRAALAAAVVATALASSAVAATLQTPPPGGGSYPPPPSGGNYPPPPGDGGYQQPPMGGSVLGLEVKSVAGNSVTGIIHCAPPDQAGKQGTFPIAPGVDINKLGGIVGIVLDGSSGTPTVINVVPPPCQFGPGQGPGPGPSQGQGNYGPAQGQGNYGQGQGNYGPGQGQGDHGGPGGPPAGFMKKSFKMDVDLEAVDGLLFDASLNKMLRGAPKTMRDFVNEEIAGETFELDATKAKCYLKDGKVTQKVACTKIATLVDNSADAINALILAKPVLADDAAAEDGEEAEASKEDISFTAKKIVVTV